MYKYIYVSVHSDACVCVRSERMNVKHGILTLQQIAGILPYFPRIHTIHRHVPKWTLTGYKFVRWDIFPE